MFPLTSNEAYIKPTGERSTLGAELGGNAYTLPTAGANTKGGVKIGSGLKMTGEVLSADQVPAHTVAEAGKVLTVADDGSLEWDDSGVGGGYWFDRIRPILGYPTTVDSVIRVEYGGFPNPPSNGVKLSHAYLTNTSRTFPLVDCIDFSMGNCIELQNYLTDAMITALGATLIGSLTTAGTSVTLDDPITDYDVIAIQGVYNDDSSGSTYDTTMLYKGIEVDTAYWFGVMDRNANYSGTITFTDATHATLSGSRRVKIFGF